MEYDQEKKEELQNHNFISPFKKSISPDLNRPMTIKRKCNFKKGDLFDI